MKKEGEWKEKERKFKKKTKDWGKNTPAPLKKKKVNKKNSTYFILII
jgi:hypothetical protein